MLSHIDVFDSIEKKIGELRKLEPKEYYRFIVPGWQHARGEGWQYFEAQKPNDLPTAFETLSFAFTRLNRLELTADLIHHIHSRVTANQEIYTRIRQGEVRQDENGYYLAKHCKFVSEEGFKEFYDIVNLLQEYGAALNIVSSDYLAHLTSRAHANRRFKRIRHEKDFKKLFAAFNECKHTLYRAPSSAYLQDLLNYVCRSYNLAIQTENKEEKLRVIAQHVQMIERLHIFPDGNGRTCLILLQRLLLQNGFLPAMLFNPDCIDGYSLDELVKEIKDGCLATKKLINVPGYRLYGYQTQLFGHAYPDANQQTEEVFFRNLRIRGVRMSEFKLAKFIYLLRYDSREAMRVETKPKFKLGRFLTNAQITFWQSQQVQALQRSDTKSCLQILYAINPRGFNLTLYHAFLIYYQACVQEYYAQQKSLTRQELKQNFLSKTFIVLPYLDVRNRQDILVNLTIQEIGEKRFLNAHRNNRFYTHYIETKSWQRAKTLLTNQSGLSLKRK